MNPQTVGKQAGRQAIIITVWICTDRNQIGGKCTLRKCNDKIIIIYQNLACVFFAFSPTRGAQSVFVIFTIMWLCLCFFAPTTANRSDRSVRILRHQLHPATTTRHGSANMLSSIAFFLIFCLFPKFGCRHIFFSVRLFCKQCRTFMHKRFTAARCKQSNKAHNGRNMVN